MRLKLLAAALVIAASAIAAELPQLRTEPTDGGSVFFVKNTSSQPLAAYLIELVDYPGSYYALYTDEVAAPLASGAEKRIQVANMTVGAVPDYVKMQAAVYADGTTAGPSEKVAQILERRRVMLETTRALVARLDQAQSAGTARTAVEADLKRWLESIPTPRKNARSQAAVNQTASRAVIGDAIECVDKKSVADALTAARASEQSLAAAKPAL